MSPKTLPPTVLLLVPDGQFRQTLTRILAPRFRTIEAATIAEGTQHIITSHPQVIVLERYLPDDDALAFVQHFRHDTLGQQAIIVFVTDRATIRDKVAGLRAGADDFVVKPIHEDTFMYRLLLLQRTPRPV